MYDDNISKDGTDVEYTAKRQQMSKCDFVAEELKEKIISGSYKSGDRLPSESALCELFSVSRITVREALKKLNMMGLVEIKQGKGTFVRSVDLGLFMKPLFPLVNFDEVDVDAIYTAREYIEGGIAYLAAKNRTENELIVLRSLLQSIRTSFQDQDEPALDVYDRAFHAQLARAAHNPILQAVYQTLNEIDIACVKRFNKYLNTYLATCYTEHLEIYAAVEQQDPERAQAAMVAHARTSRDVLNP